jgi:poly-gamma-glutamate synthesis protein (capsule biosynthesis protein)
MSEKPIIIGLAGDVLVDRDTPMEVFDRVRSVLDTPDILFANLEGPYADHPQPAPSAGVAVIPGFHNLDVFAQAGFDVMSMANNHIVDAGHVAMLDTKRRLNEQGVVTCGVGKNIAEAREPAIVEAKGIKVAFLSYSSIFPFGYEARENVPGLAPMRAYNHYHDAYPNYQAPGIEPRIETIPDQADLATLREDITKAREQADLVVTTFHWGDFMKPFFLTDHETRTARFCIDQGADMVVGHHHHILRGMEWYNGKPIFYGLGHFVFDLRSEIPAEIYEMLGKRGDDPDFYGIAPREGWPLMPLHADSRMTALAWATVSGGKIDAIGFLPCRLTPEGLVVAVDPASTEGKEVVDYVEKGCTTQGLNARIETDGAIELSGHPTVRVLSVNVD